MNGVKKKRKTYFQTKLGLFMFGLITAPFIKSNLISHKLGDYLNTANFLWNLSQNPSFPKEQEEWKLSIHSKTRFQF